MSKPLRELSLFSGAGGGLLGSILLGWETVCYVERDPYCHKVLRARMRDRMLHEGPIYDDVRTFNGSEWRGRVDVVTAGFPCQPFSVAGKQLAEADERNGWPDTSRILRQVRPRFALLENVPGLVAHRYFGTVLGDLAESGYDAEWDCFSAAAVGAPHIRDRLWILAYANAGRLQQDGLGGRLEQIPNRRPDIRSAASECCPNVAHANEPRLEGRELLPECAGERTSRPCSVGDAERVRELQPQGSEPDERRWPCDTGWWGAEPGMGRVVDGLASRMDRLRALGNGQVPPVAVRAWRELSARIPRGAVIRAEMP